MALPRVILAFLIGMGTNFAEEYTPNDPPPFEHDRSSRPSSLFGYTPPGTTSIKLDNKKLFIDRTEILNNDWAGYIKVLKDTFGKESIEYQEALPDSTLWKSVYGGEFLNYGASYGKKPIVGISLEQAKKYSEWRSKRVNEKYDCFITTYRIPSPEELKRVYSKKNCSSDDEYYPYKDHQRGKIGWRVFGLCDNVLELTSAKDSVFGGHWLRGDDVGVENRSTPSPKVGFRCIATFEKK